MHLFHFELSQFFSLSRFLMFKLKPSTCRSLIRLGCLGWSLFVLFGTAASTSFASGCEDLHYVPPKMGDWRDKSNQIVMEFVDRYAKRYPEWGSTQGLDEFDTAISLPDRRENGQRQRWLKTQRAWARKKRFEQNKAGNGGVAYDLKLLMKWIDLEIEQCEINANEKPVTIYGGAFSLFESLAPLANPSGPQHRKDALIVRLDRYIHGDSSQKNQRSWVDAAIQTIEWQLNRNYRVLAAKEQIQSILDAAAPSLEAIEAFLVSTGVEERLWRGNFQTLTQQVDRYSAFLTKTVLPKARSYQRVSERRYNFMLRQQGVDASAEELIRLSNEHFPIVFADFQALAKGIQEKYRLESANPRDVVAFLEKQAKTSGQEALQMYQNIAAEIQAAISDIITLPNTPPQVRLATEVEAVAYPYAFYTETPILKHHGILGEFVLPDIGKGKGTGIDEYYPAAAYPLWVHELRPGHDHQFAKIVELQPSIARRLFSSHSANWEGWALYAERLASGYLGLEARFMLLQSRLLRIARMRLDPEVNLGRASLDDLRAVYVDQLGLSESYAQTEYDRYIWDGAGQATTYFYGFLQIEAIRERVKKQIGSDFDLKAFNDAFLEVGMVPFRDYDQRIVKIMKRRSAQ